MTQIKEIISIMQELAPEENILQSFDDNVGLIIGSDDVKTDKVLCCLDVTNDVIDEAIDLGAQLIISHHPFIFSPIKKITDDEPLGKKILKVAESKISVYSSHTNLDCASKGINDYLARLLGLTEVTVLEKTVNGEGLGRVGLLDSFISPVSLANEIKKILAEPNIRIVSEKNASIKKVAIIGGGGGDIKYIDMARELNADCLITADIKHHVALYARDVGLTLIEPTHYSMEQAYIKELTAILKEMADAKGIKVQFLPSKQEKSPYTLV